MADRISGARICAFVAFACELTLLATICSPAVAADASAWDGNARAAVRLIAAAPSKVAPGGALRAGIEIRLGAGWKTYWRYARSEEHTSELQSRFGISYAVFC